MDQPVNPDERDPSVIAVAAVSVVAGLACTLAPAATARFAGIDASPGVLRLVGLADLALALALGLYIGRPSWPWMVARAASNPMIAAVALASARSRRCPRARCRPSSRHRIRPADRGPAPRRLPLTGWRPSDAHL